MWRPRRYLHQPPPRVLQEWLLDTGSLTQRLLQSCQGKFRVDVVSLKWQRPMRNEARRLGLRLHQRALIREVRLLCNEQPWVFARTVIPFRTLKGALRYLVRLGTRPLGAVLFADPHMQREELELACINRNMSLFESAMPNGTANTSCIWGRRSVFYLENKPLLVSEIFLPGLPSHPLQR